MLDLLELQDLVVLSLDDLRVEDGAWLALVSGPVDRALNSLEPDVPMELHRLDDVLDRFDLAQLDHQDGRPLLERLQPRARSLADDILDLGRLDLPRGKVRVEKMSLVIEYLAEQFATADRLAQARDAKAPRDKVLEELLGFRQELFFHQLHRPGVQPVAEV